MRKIVTTMTLTVAMLSAIAQAPKTDNVQWQIEQFDDIKVLQYRVPGFEELPLEQKKLVYYLSQAALCGRDILFDQHFKYNLAIRKQMEQIYTTYKGDKGSADWANFEKYLKKVWFANGIHHHYSNDKFVPDFSRDYYLNLLTACGLKENKAMMEAIFDEALFPKRVSQDSSKDLVLGSAVNFYEGVTQPEVEAYYAAKADPNDKTPVSHGLNTRVTKVNGKIAETPYKSGGLYGSAIDKIVLWLEKAMTVAENDMQRQTIATLVDYYKTGDLKKFDEYNILWLRDTLSNVDFVNGFIENYTDPLGTKATWESMVNFKDVEATKRTDIISANAQWFEDNSPVPAKYKKPVVKGVSAKVITAAIIGGDCYPATPIGINLPNADWIRRDHGSKSVTIGNFTYAYDRASEGGGFGAEFYTPEIQTLMKQFGAAAKDVAVDLHECLGHGSGQLAPGVKGDELKNYGSPLEEARAELFALYYIADPKLVELGVLPTAESAKAEYNSFMFNGLMGQLTRIKPGATVEQAHMRCRQLIATWALELAAGDRVMELIQNDGKTYLQINDYDALRSIVGKMLAEIQRIKSEGDYAAGRALIEKYAVQVDQTIHAEVLARYSKLNIAPYSGFVNPVYTPIYNAKKEITDIKVEYPANYTEQHLNYSKNYSFLK